MNAQFVVVDASVILKLMVEEEDTGHALALVDDWADTGVRIFAPHFMLSEATNGLLKKMRRREIGLEEALLFFNRISGISIDFLQPVSLSSRALELAHELRQSDVYDSHYLALAESLNCEFWTADRRFYNSANRSHPRVRWIGELRPEATVD